MYLVTQPHTLLVRDVVSGTAETGKEKTHNISWSFWDPSHEVMCQGSHFFTGS